ncbi:uncharacterized protein MONOS_17274 [Monocercomonoides exilis]|uniref:uncharacterized protein n=1 Tax=Monocercomonoides exilis TaxID=2049356 RepID=UPI00355AA797|nr:hypothetical protein MONOS_17274 [Monocercomonoides exilis]
MCLYHWLYGVCAAPSTASSPDAKKKSTCAKNGKSVTKALVEKKRFCDEVCEDKEYVPMRSGGASAVEKERGADRADERDEEEVVEMITDEVTAAGKFDEVVGAATAADCWRLSG